MGAPHQDWNANANAGNDIAVLVLESEAPAEADRYDILRTYEDNGRVFEKVGYGQIGNGNTGWEENTSRTRYAGENRYDYAFPDRLFFDFDNGTEAQNSLSRMGADSDLGLGQAREASPAKGDSGGPSFVAGKIAGVTSYGFGWEVGGWNVDDGPNPDISPGTNGSFGEIAVDTRVSHYADWIDAKTAPAIMVNGIEGDVAQTNARAIQVSIRDFGQNVTRFEVTITDGQSQILDVVDGMATVRLPSSEGNYELTVTAAYEDGFMRAATASVNYVRPRLTINDGSGLTNTGRITTNLDQLASDAVEYQILVNGYVVQDWGPASEGNQSSIRLNLKSTNYLQGKIRYTDGRTQATYAQIRYENAKLELNAGNSLTNTGVVRPALSDLASDAEQVRFRINGGSYTDWMPVDDILALPHLNYVGMNYLQAQVQYSDEVTKTLYAKIEYAKPSILLDDGVTVTNSRDITVKLSGVDSSVKAMRVVVNSWSFPSESEDYQAQFQYQLPNYRGKNYVNVELEYEDGRRIWLYTAIELN